MVMFSHPGTARYSGCCEQVHCRGEAATICLVTTLVSSCAQTKVYTAGYPCRLAALLSCPVARTYCS